MSPTSKPAAKETAATKKKKAEQAALELHHDLIRSQGGKVFKLKTGNLAFLELNDQHHYWLNGKYMTSVTHLLDVAGPVPWSLKDFWQRNDKETAEAIFERAGDFGTKLHDAFEKLLNGVELHKSDYPTLPEQKAIDSFMKWVQLAKPQDFISEQIVASKKYEYAGTLDFVGTIDKSKADWMLGTKRKPYEAPEKDKPERWLIDFKTTSGIYFKHELQVAAYRQAYEESYGEKIDRMGIVRISARHKAGWEFKEVTRDISEFMNIYDTYCNMNGGEMPEPPEMVVYPDTFKLFEEVEQPGKVSVAPGKAFIDGKEIPGIKPVVSNTPIKDAKITDQRRSGGSNGAASKG